MPGAFGLLFQALLSGLPLWGQHCGPGHGHPAVPPADALDAACYVHDACIAACHGTGQPPLYDGAWSSACACTCHAGFHAELLGLAPHPPEGARSTLGLFTRVTQALLETVCDVTGAQTTLTRPTFTPPAATTAAPPESAQEP